MHRKVKLRHPGEGRDPASAFSVMRRKNWIPAFAGMTMWRVTRLMRRVTRND
jgi:hypothetical protein